MKRKLSLFLAVVLAMTMVMGMSVTVFAAPHPDEYNISVITKSGHEMWAKKEKLYTVTTQDDQQHYTVWMVRIYDATQAIDENYNYSILFEDSEGNVYDTSTALSKADLEGVFSGGALGTTKESVAATIAALGNEEYSKSLHLFGWTEDSKPTNAPLSPTHEHNFQWQTITEPTKDTDGLEGEVCSCGATRNTQPLSAFGFILNDYAPSLVKAAKPGQTVTFEFGEWNSFPKEFMAKLVDKSAQNVTFVFHYNWNHVKQEITIPAGTPIDLNFDWYGPAKMAELYGNN